MDRKCASESTANSCVDGHPETKPCLRLIVTEFEYLRKDLRFFLIIFFFGSIQALRQIRVVEI